MEDFLNKKIVFIDDQVLMREYFEGFAAFYGFKNIHIYPSVESFVREHTKLEMLSDIDLLLTDHHLGEGKTDGYMLSYRLRGFGLKFPIIIISADTLVDFSLFTNQTLIKPFAIETLMEAICKQLHFVNESINDSRRDKPDDLDFMKDIH